MPDAKQVSESSADTGNLTGADVDFSAYERGFLADKAGKPAKESESEPVKEPIKAESAPAKGEAPATEQVDEPKAPVVPALTSDDVAALIDGKLASLKPKAEPLKEDPYPTLGDPQYTSVEQCEKAQAQWFERRTDQKISEHDAKREEEAKLARTQEEQFLESKRRWEEREAEAKTRHADYEGLKQQALSRPFNETAFQFLANSKVGPDLFVHYVKNPEEWSELIALPPEDIRVEMRIMERELRRSLAAGPAPTGKTISDTPPPPRTITSNSSPADDPREKAAVDNDFSAYERNWMAERARDRMGRFT